MVGFTTKINPGKPCSLALAYCFSWFSESMNIKSGFAFLLIFLLMFAGGNFFKNKVGYFCCFLLGFQMKKKTLRNSISARNTYFSKIKNVFVDKECQFTCAKYQLIPTDRRVSHGKLVKVSNKLSTNCSKSSLFLFVFKFEKKVWETEYQREIHIFQK